MTRIPSPGLAKAWVVLAVVAFLAGCSGTPEVESLEAGEWTPLIAKAEGDEIYICLDTSFVLTSYPAQCGSSDPEINAALVGDEVPRLREALPKFDSGFLGFRGEFTAKHVDGKWELTGFRNLVFATSPGPS